MSQAITTPEEVEHAITLAENAPTKKSKKSKKQPLKARPKRKLNYGEEGPPKRVKTVSKKKMKQLQAATNQFQPMEEASEDEDNDEDEESQSLLPEESQLAETQVAASDDDGSNNDDDDEDDVTAITAVFESKGDEAASDSDKSSSSSENSDSDEASDKASDKEKSMPRIDVDLSADSDDDAAVDVNEFEQSQRVDLRNHMEPQIDDEDEVVVDDAKKHSLDMGLLEEYEVSLQCDAKKLYEFAKTVFTDEDIEAFMRREMLNPDIRINNHCFNIISSMVTGDFRGEKRHYETLMVMFIAELLKNIDEKFTGIQNAFDQTSNYVDVRVKQVIQTVNNKSEGTKTIQTFVKQLFAEMESHGKWQPEEVFNHMFVEDDEPNIEGILRTTKLEQLQSLISKNVNPNELNLLTMFPLDDLCILEDIESLKKEFRKKNPKPKKPDMERALELSSSKELHAYFAEYKQKDEAYKKKEKNFIETARHNAKKESFLLTLLKSTSLILDCCKKGDEESFQTLQKTICKLAKAFKKRVKAAPQEVQAAVRLGYEKLRLYQTIFANEKSEPERYTYYVEKRLGFCFENAIKMKKNNSDLQYINYEPEDKKDKKKNEAYYYLMSQKEWAKRITGIQLHVNSKGKSCFLPPPILDVAMNDEVATDKKFKHFFAVLHLASMSHCLMDRRAFYHPRYYGLYHRENLKVACPCYRWNQALTLLSEVFLKPSDLKK